MAKRIFGWFVVLKESASFKTKKRSARMRTRASGRCRKRPRSAQESVCGLFVRISIVLFLAAVTAGSRIKARCSGQIAPGVWLLGVDLSGMSPAEAEAAAAESLPEFYLELTCSLLPEMVREAEKKVQEAGDDAVSGAKVRISGNEWCLTVKTPMVRMLMAETMEEVLACSNDVKVWEWLYAAVFGRPFRVRRAEPELVWEERYFSELLFNCAELLEREKQEAEIEWKDGKIIVKESRTGFRIDTGRVSSEAEKIITQVTEKIKTAPADGIIIRLTLGGTALMPSLSTAQAKKCDTKLAEFTTGYQGAGSGRAQNITAGAGHLNARVILPQEEFSTAAALMPFTEQNGYTAGGTYVSGQLSESIGGGVCQLSTTLYNALLRTKLEITERYAHSMPVGYIPPGQDAAIAGDYKDLKFQNTTDAPVLLLCTAGGGQVRVTLYGSAEAARRNVTIESVMTEKTKEGMTVEVYRTEKGEGGEGIREKISTNRYRYFKGNAD